VWLGCGRAAVGPLLHAALVSASTRRPVRNLIVSRLYRRTRAWAAIVSRRADKFDSPVRVLLASPIARAVIPPPAVHRG
jgi:hypothetical protein